MAVNDSVPNTPTIHHSTTPMTRTIIVGLGNDLLADDAVGIHVVRQLKQELTDEWIDIVECSAHGLAIMDLFIDYDRAILVDALVTGKHPPGTIVEIPVETLRSVPNPSPHFAGVPEMVALAEQLGVNYPDEFHILGVEVADPFTLGGDLHPAVRAAIPSLCRRVCDLLNPAEIEETMVV